MMKFEKPSSALPGRPSARRKLFGRAWYARWASESPSTTRRGREEAGDIVRILGYAGTDEGVNLAGVGSCRLWRARLRGCGSGREHRVVRRCRGRRVHVARLDG